MRPVKIEPADAQSRTLSECSASRMTPSARQILAHERSRFLRVVATTKDHENTDDAMTSDVVTHASSDYQPNLARPWAAHRHGRPSWRQTSRARIFLSAS